MRDRFIFKILVSTAMLSFAWTAHAQSDPVAIATRFLPPNAKFAEFVKADPSTGKPISRDPAVLTGNVVSSRSQDIVFAYDTHAPDLAEESLFIALLHKTDKGYIEVSVLPYYGRFLWSQNFSTTGLALVRLHRSHVTAIAVVTAIGASLGARVEVFRWNPAIGLHNVFPENSGAHYVDIIGSKDTTSVKLRFEKYPGETGAPPPQTFTWNGETFRKLP